MVTPPDSGSGTGTETPVVTPPDSGAGGGAETGGETAAPAAAAE